MYRVLFWKKYYKQIKDESQKGGERTHGVETDPALHLSVALVEVNGICAGEQKGQMNGSITEKNAMHPQFI